jgi:anti-sigma-K factor RskA
MTCEELADEYELHALGLSDGPERAELEEHLRTGCATCRDGVRRARDLNAGILTITPPAQPSNQLRTRILASVGVRPRRSAWLWGAIPAGVLAGLIIGFVLRAPQTSPDSARLRQIVDLLNDPQTKQVTFAPGPRGRVFVHPQRGVLLLANNLPQLPRGKTFELWVIPKGGAPKPAGLFKADAGGNAVYRADSTVDTSGLGAVAVSVEPEAGSPAPTTTPIIVAPLAD